MNKSFLLFLMFLFSFGVGAIEPSKMIVVVNDQQKTQLTGLVDVRNFLNRIDSEFEIYSLDDVEHFESSFSKDLPGDEKLARIAIQKKYDEIGEEKLSSMVLKAYQAKILTMKFHLEKYPAIIFDDAYVVYGEWNLNKALNYYLDMENEK